MDPLNLDHLAGLAHMARSHFVREFSRVFGETPHRYLQRRRVERAMYLLACTKRDITEICLDVGFTSLSTFSRTFREIVGEPPLSFRGHAKPIPVPNCFAMASLRPSSFG